MKISKRKKIIILISCLIYVCIVVPASYFAFINNYSYSLKTDGTYEITDVMFIIKYLILPANYKGKPVTSIDINVTIWDYEYVYLSRNIEYVNLFAISSTSLKVIEVSNYNDYYDSLDGVLFSEGAEDLIRYPDAKEGNIYQIPNSVNTIKTFAITNNPYIETIVIPESVSNISGGAIAFCPNVKTIEINAEIPPLIEGHSFLDNNAELIIYVPTGSLEAYQSSSDRAAYYDILQGK
jgi:hypothetical protein